MGSYYERFKRVPSLSGRRAFKPLPAANDGGLGLVPLADWFTRNTSKKGVRDKDVAQAAIVLGAAVLARRVPAPLRREVARAFGAELFQGLLPLAVNLLPEFVENQVGNIVINNDVLQPVTITPNAAMVAAGMSYSPIFSCFPEDGTAPANVVQGGGYTVNPCATIGAILPNAPAITEYFPGWWMSSHGQRLGMTNDYVQHRVYEAFTRPITLDPFIGTTLLPLAGGGSSSYTTVVTRSAPNVPAPLSPQAQVSYVSYYPDESHVYAPRHNPSQPSVLPSLNIHLNPPTTHTVISRMRSARKLTPRSTLVQGKAARPQARMGEHRLKPASKGTKERKVRLSSAAAAYYGALKVYGGFTESRDFVRAIYKTLPRKYKVKLKRRLWLQDRDGDLPYEDGALLVDIGKYSGSAYRHMKVSKSGKRLIDATPYLPEVTKRRPSMAEMLDALAKHWDHIDPKKAAGNIVAQEIKDATIGEMSRRRRKNQRELLGKNQPVGFEHRGGGASALGDLASELSSFYDLVK